MTSPCLKPATHFYCEEHYSLDSQLANLHATVARWKAIDAQWQTDYAEIAEKLATAEATVARLEGELKEAQAERDEEIAYATDCHEHAGIFATRLNERTHALRLAQDQLATAELARAGLRSALEGLRFPLPEDPWKAPEQSTEIVVTHAAIRTANDTLAADATAPSLGAAVRELVQAVTLAIENFGRQDASGNFLGDDDHEAWTALIAARETLQALAPWLCSSSPTS